MPKVLIVDDEPAVLTSTALLLKDMGYECVECSDVSRIVELARAESPDVILQDVRMPGLDLDAMMRELRAALPKRIPVVLFSASLDAQETRDRLEVAGLVEKPFRPQALVHALGHAMTGA